MIHKGIIHFRIAPQHIAVKRRQPLVVVLDKLKYMITAVIKILYPVIIQNASRLLRKLYPIIIMAILTVPL